MKRRVRWIACSAAFVLGASAFWQGLQVTRDCVYSDKVSKIVRFALRVRQVLKSGGQEIGDTYVFNAPGGETATKVFLSDYEFSESEEVVVFLNGYDVPFGPYDTYWFSDGSTEVPADKLPASAQGTLSSEAEPVTSVPVSTEDFLALIESFV